MGFLSFLFGGKKNNDDEDIIIRVPAEHLTVDIHSHFLPSLDDGSQSMEETLAMLKGFADLGYEKVITTPHIMTGAYDNSADTILPALHRVQHALEEAGIEIRIEAAAEHYFDEHFMARVKAEEKLLTFGNNYLLFETGFLNEPKALKEGIAELIWQGYKPVLAHPERYAYLNGNWRKVEEYRETGVLFQLNSMSLTGYYDLPAKKMAERMIERGWVEFVGSDCHRAKHLEEHTKVLKTKLYKELLSLPLLNRSL